MKKVFTFVLAALMVAAMAGCNSSDNSSSTVQSSQMESVESSQAESMEESSTATAAGTGMQEGKTLEGFLEAVNGLYPDLTPTPVDDAMLKDLYMVDPENVETYVGETSLINVQAFDIVVVQAKEGKVEEVKASLEQRKQNRISEFEFYPVNGNDETTKNGLVLTSGDYAILVICDNYDGVQEILDEYFTF